MIEKRAGKEDRDMKKKKPTSSVPGNPEIGLALGSGMARGFAHIGVLKVLQKHGIYPGIIAGSSMGAVVGGCYLAGHLTEFESWALSLNRYKILSYMDFKIRSAGLVGGEKLTGMMEDYFKDIKIEDLPHPFIAIAADISTGHEIWLRKGSLIDSLRASFALPGIFTPVEINKRLLVDGALVNPCPVSVCQALGARLTIAVDLNTDLIGKAARPGNRYQKIAGFDIFDEKDVSPEAQKPFKRSAFTRRLFRREENSPSLFGVMISSMNIVQDRLTRSRLAGDPPDIHIKPQVGHIGLLEFEKGEDLINAGKSAALAALPEIKAAIEVLL